MEADAVLEVRGLGVPGRFGPWETLDPFLFCVHHLDIYPAGNERLGPAVSLEGRQLGMDFEGKDGWRMYHGDVVPGFPQHPHRGFETITIARSGLLDHSDSLGATARFGEGDVQWMTAGSGIVHSEMFPLLDPKGPNRAELFQIWLNLPAKDKLAPPHFSMFWSQKIPKLFFRDHADRGTEVALYAGSMQGLGAPPPPPPNSWASDPKNGVAICTIKLSPGARWALPGYDETSVNRTLYFFEGSELSACGQTIRRQSLIRVRPEEPILFENGDEEAELLMLQGRPISEPVAHHGPFVMNNRAELQQAFVDYHRTQFGGWPWSTDSPVHDREKGRFAIHADGREERPD